jgi:hypothetical protein
MLTPEFMKGEASRRGFTQCGVFSSPVQRIDIEVLREGSLDGDELLMIGRLAQ